MNYKKYSPLVLSLGAGVLGFLLRVILYRVGFDQRGFLPSSHPLHIACLVLTILTAGYLLFTVRKLGRIKNPQRNFPDHPLRTASALGAACLMVVYGVTALPESDSGLTLLRSIFALGAAVAMALQFPAFRRIPGLEVWRHGLVSVFFALDLLCRYQGWSGNPQLPDYTFQVFACIALTLTSYHRLAFSANLGKRRTMLFSSLMALFLCLVCTAGPDTPVFYLGGAFWSGSCLGTFRRSKSSRQPRQDT